MRVILITLFWIINSYIHYLKSFPVYAAHSPVTTKASIIYTHLVVNWTQKLYLELEEF